MKYRFIPTLVAVALCLLLWQIVSNFIPTFLLPTPYVTLRKTIFLLFSSEFAFYGFNTLIKVTTSFTIAYLSSNIVAFISKNSAYAERFIKPIIFIIMNTPGVIAVFLAIVIMGTRGPVSLVITSLLLFVELFNVLYPSYKNIKSEYSELAYIYKLSKPAHIIHVILPQLMPQQFSAIRLGMSLGWKLTLLTEVFTFNNGVGYQIQRHFNLFSITGVLAWYISFTLIMLLIEYVVIRPLEKKLVYYPVVHSL